MSSEIVDLEWVEANGLPPDWNGPVAREFIELRPQDLDRSIISHIEHVAHRVSARCAISSPTMVLSYGELWARTRCLADAIGTETTQGDIVGILMPICPMATVAMLACLAAGRTFVMLDVNYPSTWIQQVLREARPALIVGEDSLADVMNTDLPTVRCLFVPSGLPPPSAGWQPAAMTVDEAACVLFTSGSTGSPKGVVNSQRALLQRVAQAINSAHINVDDRLLTLASHCTIVGIRDLLTALTAGASVHLIDPSRAGAREILHALESERVTVLFGFPDLIRSLLACEDRHASADLRLVRLGGDATYWSDVDRLRTWLAPGASIQLIFAATEAPIMQWFVDESLRGESACVPIGYPIPGNHVAVVDEDDCAVQPGQVGELIVGGRYVALGVWVGGRFVADHGGLSGPPSDRRFRTGDLVRRRPDGMLEHLGRKDRQVKIRGTRIDLGEVEAALRRHPRVRDSAALVRSASHGSGLIVVAYASVLDAATGIIEELRQLTRSLPAVMYPARLYLIDRMPRLPNSKLDVRAMMALDQLNAATERAPVASPPTVAAAAECVAPTVARVWQQVLGRAVHRCDEDFFEAGGDSLAAITLTTQLEQLLGIELSLTLINEAPQFGKLCEALRSRRATHYVPFVLLKAGEDLPPLYLVHGAGGNVAELFQVARAVSYAGPVFGIQARGLARNESPHTTVEAMAADYVAQIRSRQPTGPYYLCGYSFGGLVAFEMALRLRRAGEDVGLLGLFDTLPSSITQPFPIWRASASERFRQRIRHAKSACIAEWSRLARATMHRAATRLNGDAVGFGAPKRTALPGFLKAAPASTVRVAASALIASARYRPQYYPGELILFIPADRDHDRPASETAWLRHAQVVSIFTTPGRHLTMLSGPNAASVAALLSRCLPDR